MKASTSAYRRILQVSGLALVMLYIVGAAFPLILLLFGEVPKGGGRWWDFSMALGFAGLAMMGLQFVLTARFRRLAHPFGMDIIYYFHRWAALGAFVLVAAHYIILRLVYPASLPPANPVVAPWQITCGRVAILIFGGLIVSSIWRKQLKIEYDRWRLWHGILAAAGVLLAILHIQGVGYYTRAAWKGSAWLAYSIAWLFLLLFVRIIKPWLLLRRPWRVAAVTAERGDSWTVRLEATAGQSLSFRPGQFAWLTLDASPFRGCEHPFSFAGSAEVTERLEFTIKELGDFTRTIRYIKPGTSAYVDGPYGAFTTDLYPERPGFGFVAGGVGIAPIMSILRTLADRGDQRPLFLFYGNASWDRVLFREALEQLRQRLHLTVVHTLQNPPPEWKGSRGFITEEIIRSALPENRGDFEYFLCGPVPMTRSVTQALRRLDISRKRIHLEHFDMV